MNVVARPLPRVAVAMAAVVLLAACASTPAPTAPPTASATPAPSATPTPIHSPLASRPPTPPPPTATPTPPATPPPTPSPAASLGPTDDPLAGVLPLPEDLRLPKGDFPVTPDSPRGMAMGVALPYDLGHCGLYSPVDLDGSLWEPIGAVDPDGGPIDTDEEVGQLINGTPGEVLLVTSDRLDWRATQGVRVVVVFQRLPGPRSYPGCM